MIKSLQQSCVMIVVALILSPLLCTNSLSRWTLGINGSQKGGQVQSTQKKTWEPIFFKEIDQRAKLAGLNSLRRAKLPKTDIELRVWTGFGVIPLEGFVIKKTQGQWSATHIRSISPQLARRDYQKTLPAPKSGWAPFWQHLVEEGVLTLPDSSELKGQVLAADGESFVVEVNRDGFYRTYLYSNPALQKWPEARKIIDIVQSIYDEFGVQRKLLRN